jgi:hypothetical protein
MTELEFLFQVTLLNIWSVQSSRQLGSLSVTIALEKVR